MATELNGGAALHYTYVPTSRQPSPILNPHSPQQDGWPQMCPSVSSSVRDRMRASRLYVWAREAPSRMRVNEIGEPADVRQPFPRADGRPWGSDVSTRCSHCRRLKPRQYQHCDTGDGWELKASLIRVAGHGDAEVHSGDMGMLAASLRGETIGPGTHRSSGLRVDSP